MTEPRPLDRTAIVYVIFLCLLWALQQVAVKLAAPDIPSLTQAAIRSFVATAILTVYALRTTPGLTARDGSLWPGLAAGVLFSLEFVALFLALKYTGAGRVTLFLYSAPFFVALGLPLLLPNERLSRLQWLGLTASFVGVALALGVFSGAGRADARGDLLALAAGALWGATTLIIKTTALRRIPPVKTLLYQLGLSAPVLAAAAVFAGERVVAWPGALALASLAFQTLVVGCFSYLAWFGLITRYRAGEVSVFTFAAPLFGMMAGWTILGEPLTAGFVGAVALVAAGIVLVNLPKRA
ncbi:MAG: DMT family transporter [Methylobacteriaceae bacterium]|nr:DMT family transporter [Methylobacteriaceae bacterium]